jgi:hypothetical protein
MEQAVSGWFEGRSIHDLRGMAEPDNERTKKYSPESYCAQYGLPRDVCQDLWNFCGSHQEVVERIYKEYLSVPEIRSACIQGKTRPFSELEE